MKVLVLNCGSSSIKYQLIETSLISGHFANQSNNIYLDIFSCKFYDPNVVAEFAKKFFQAQDFNIAWVLRK